MSNLKDIVNVSIEIAAPVVDSTSFDHLLIFGPAPAVAPAAAPADVAVYSSLDEVTDAGWVANGDNADPVGIAARVAFSQTPQPAKIYIAVRKEADVSATWASAAAVTAGSMILAGGRIYSCATAGATGETEPEWPESGTVTDGTAVWTCMGTTVLESPVATLARAILVSGWYIACPAGIDEEDYEDCAAYIETQTKLFCFPVFDNLEVVGAVYYRSFGIFAKETWEQHIADVPDANRYIHVAFCAKCLYYDSGSETWAFKTLSAIYPSELSSQRVEQLKTANISYYMTYSSRNITQGGKVMAGEWIDVIRFRDWLQNDMQIRIFNLLVVNPKIPYTNAGISLVENQMIASLKAGAKAGGVAPDEYDENGDTIPGFLVSVPNALSLTAAQKASRILTNCRFTARLAGAIHVIEVNGVLCYEY